MAEVAETRPMQLPAVGLRARLWYWGWVVLVVGLALAFAVMALRGAPAMLDQLDYPFQVDYGEGVVISQAARLAQGLELYPASDISGPGFVGANYPPLYYLAITLMPSHPASIYFGARLLSLLGYLLVAGLAGVLVARTTRFWPAGFLTAAALLVVPPAREWGVFAKPDLLALAFSTAGLLVASVAPRRVLWTAPLFALALLTKQTAVAAPLAVGLWLLLTPGRRRQAVLLGGLTAGLTLGPLVALELGPAEVVWHLVVANARGWFWDRFDDIGLAFLEIYRPMLLATLLLPLAWWRRPLTPLALYLPLAVATLLAAGLPGSSRNYAIEAGLALAIGAGLVVGWLGQSRQALARGLALGCVVLIGWQAVVLWNLPERTYGRRPPTAEATGRMRVMLNFLRNEAAPGPVLSENVGLVVQAGRPVEYNDPSLMYKLAQAGTWDQQPLLDQLNARHFAVIMTEINLETSPERAGRWTPEMIAAIQANYRVLHRDVLIIYTPRE